MSCNGDNRGDVLSKEALAEDLFADKTCRAYDYEFHRDVKMYSLRSWILVKRTTFH